jgi:hypothetical protein
LLLQKEEEAAEEADEEEEEAEKAEEEEEEVVVVALLFISFEYYLEGFCRHRVFVYAFDRICAHICITCIHSIQTHTQDAHKCTGPMVAERNHKALNLEKRPHTLCTT